MTSPKEIRHRRAGNKSATQLVANKIRVSDRPKSHIYIYIAAAAILIILLTVVYISFQIYLKEQVKRPLNAATMLSKDHDSAKSEPSRFWGMYRPHMYFGMKTRSPRSPVFGLMWLNQLAGQMPPAFRHWCDQGDKLLKYGWLKHDGVNFGTQEIQDNDFILTTEFVKRPGGDHGGDWTARINVQPNAKDPERPRLVSLLFYAALDGQGQLSPILAKSSKRLNGISGFADELGHFRLTFPKSVSNTSYRHSFLVTFSPGLDNIKEAVTNGIGVEAWDQARKVPYFVLGGHQVPKDMHEPNLVVFQVTTSLPYEMEVVFESESFINRPNHLQGSVFNELLTKHQSDFDLRFEQKFNLKSKGFSDGEIDFAKATLSNMVGSIGYFYGSSLVQSVYNKEPVSYWNAALYSAVPSRSFFPRGFLWDEGFHNLLISKWDSDISKDILSHWLDLMNAEGWIPREQILGVEARARVPDEFVVQRNENANPPTLILPLQRLVQDTLKSPNEKDKVFLKAVLPRLKAWFGWYNATQVGAKPFTYRWRGRDAKGNKELNPKTLTSGLDDYPRASHPTDAEYHVDLRCWIALASGLIADIAKLLDEDGREYATTHKLLTDNGLLDRLHWSEKSQQYSDYGLHTDKVRLDRPKLPQNLQPGQRPPPQNLDKIRVVITEPQLGFVSAFGYVSLFPFLLRIVEPTSPKLMRIMSDMRNERLIWTDFGLRSLSQTAALYNRYNTEHDPPYWRGAIWININYLALSALNHYKSVDGPYRSIAAEIYSKLRDNIVKNIYTQYQKTGYIWENYNDKTGEGKGCHPFTGWSALVTLIMAEIYD